MKPYNKLNDREKDEMLFNVLVENAQLRKDLEEAIEAREFWYGEYQRLNTSAKPLSEVHIEPVRCNGAALGAERVVEVLDAKSV